MVKQVTNRTMHAWLQKWCDALSCGRQPQYPDASVNRSLASTQADLIRRLIADDDLVVRLLTKIDGLTPVIGEDRARERVLEFLVNAAVAYATLGRPSGVKPVNPIRRNEVRDDCNSPTSTVIAPRATTLQHLT